MRKSQQLSLIAIFGALHVVLYFVSFGLWRNWAIYIESIEGILLGPQAGFLAAFLGSTIARTIRPDSFWIFGIIAEPVSVLATGFLARGKWKPTLAIYVVMLGAYFIHPYGRQLPLWTILDILVALIVIYPVAKLGNYLFGNNTKRLAVTLALVSFVCIATDSLVRVFLLVPCGLYTLFFDSYAGVEAVFVGAAASSYIEDAIVTAVSFVAGVPILLAASKLGIFPQKNQQKKK
jgi:uncharacterized membrane protein